MMTATEQNAFNFAEKINHAVMILVGFALKCEKDEQATIDQLVVGLEVKRSDTGRPEVWECLIRRKASRKWWQFWKRGA